MVLFLGNRSVDPMIGQRFGRLEVKRVGERNKTDPYYRFYDCLCDCGTMATHIRSDSLRKGRTKSCGCIRRETARKLHGK